MLGDFFISRQYDLFVLSPFNIGGVTGGFQVFHRLK
jgi:hypothetical protein